MYFGSKYVYKYAHSEEESVSEDEDEKLMLDSASRLSGDRKESKDEKRQASSLEKKRKHLRKPDTNVLSIKFDRLLKPGEMHAGDPIRCIECDAYASNLSNIHAEENNSNEDETKSAEQKTTWKCDFCSHINFVDIEQSDLPKQEDATYLITPAPLIHASDMTGLDDSMIIFLIDISGSMSCTTLVQGRLNLPNELRNDERMADRFGGEAFIPQRDRTYVSRLQGVQMAVAANLDKLLKDTPTKRALLLTFNHEITYYGDGTRAEPLVIRGDKLNSREDLLREAENEQNIESKPVSETKDDLVKRIYDLEESGQTALGPAVVFALEIASKRPGSQLFICTDGLANRGLGNLEAAQDEKIDPDLKLKALEDGNRFYADLTEQARGKGVGISVITIKGTTCLLPVIGQMADGTGGNVNIVDLMNIRDEFASILEQKIIATNAVATLVLHRALYIRNPESLEEKLQKTTRNIGNVTKNTEITFEFGVRDKKELKEKYNINIDDQQQLPFQIQVSYTGADGSQALRVLTQLKEATERREIAEIHAVRSIIAENHIRRTADDMMLQDSDEEDKLNHRRRLKFSTPTVQRQRLAYMDRLNDQVQLRDEEEADEFNEKRWKVASNDLKSRVVVSESRKTSSCISSIRHDTPDYEASRSSKASARRTYGFSTIAASRYTDCESEDLYRYKNISSDYMRARSPIREENPDPIPILPPTRVDDDDDDDNDHVATRSSKSQTKTRSRMQHRKK